MIDSLSFDERLQRSRRLDFRFLLDRPELGDVAWIGRPDDELRSALDLFAQGRVVDLTGSRDDPSESFDLLVAVAPRKRELQDALSCVRPGGSVYVETRASGRAHARHLRERGFVRIRRHLHWPDFEACRVILDLEAPAALRVYLVRKWPDWRGRAASKAATVLLAAGLLDRVVSHCSVSARRDMG